VYTSHLKTLYSSIDVFLDIENELVNIIEKDMKCTLVGDFNAKTAVLEDFSEPDETFLNVMDVNVEDDLYRYCYDYQVLLDNNISLKRYTQCECRPNNFVIFNYNGSFVKARAKLMYQACKAFIVCIEN
jgi:hypothetical protein